MGLEACDIKAWLGWWGKGPCLIPEVELARRWPIAQGNVKEPFATVKMRRGLWLFGFENRDEVDCVLKFGRRVL